MIPFGCSEGEGQNNPNLSRQKTMHFVNYLRYSSSRWSGQWGTLLLTLWSILKKDCIHPSFSFITSVQTMVKWCKFGVVEATKSFAGLPLGVNDTITLETISKCWQLYVWMVYDIIYYQIFAVIPTIDESNTRWTNKRQRWFQKKIDVSNKRCVYDLLEPLFV